MLGLGQTLRVVLFSFPNSVSKNKPNLKLCPQNLAPTSLLITILSLQITGVEIKQCGEYNLDTLLRVSNRDTPGQQHPRQAYTGTG